MFKKNILDFAHIVLFFFRVLKSKIFLGKESLKLIENNFTNKLHVIGNGPDANKTIASFSNQNDHFLMVNGAFEDDLFLKIKPKFLVGIDPVLFIDTTMFESSKNLENIDWKLTYITTINHKKSPGVMWLKKQKNISLKYILAVPFTIEYSNLTRFLYKKNLATSHFINVSEAAIYSGINLGYKKIFVHGVYADIYKYISINKKNDILYNNRYFYKTEQRNLTQEGSLKPGNLALLFTNVSKWLNGIYLLNQYAKDLNVRILNLTKNSMIDSLDRKDN